MNGKQCVQVFRDLEQAREPWLDAWEENAKYCQPRRYHDLRHSGNQAGQTTQPDLAVSSDVFDSTGGQALYTLASGMFAWTTPRSKPWLKYSQAPGTPDSDEVTGKLDEVTDITRRALSASNFYTKAFEVQLDRSCFGTACAGRFVRNGRLHFTSEKDFVCSEGPDEEIDTVIVRRIYSHRQAAGAFGADNLPADVAKYAADPTRQNETAEYIHACYPAADYDPDGPPSKRFPFRSKWVHLDSGHEISEGGAWENPYIVTRFLTWSGMDPKAPYGWSPAFMAVPDLRQLNRLEQLQDALMDTQMNPRVLVPSSLVGRVDFRPRGVTVIPESGQMPQEWLTQGRGDFGAARAEEKRGRIRDHFMNDLFKVFSQLDRPQMTAAEVYAILGERLDNASPTFDLYHIDWLEPMMRWAFNSQARIGAFGPLESFPAEMMSQGMVPTPEVTFLSRIAIEAQAAQEEASYKALERLLPLFEFDPEVALQFDLPKFARKFFTGSGADFGYLRNPAQVRKILRQAQAAQEQAQIAEMGQQMAA